MSSVNVYADLNIERHKQLLKKKNSNKSRRRFWCGKKFADFGCFLWAFIISSSNFLKRMVCEVSDFMLADNLLKFLMLTFWLNFLNSNSWWIETNHQFVRCNNNCIWIVSMIPGRKIFLQQMLKHFSHWDSTARCELCYCFFFSYLNEYANSLREIENERKKSSSSFSSSSSLSVITFFFLSYLALYGAKTVDTVEFRVEHIAIGLLSSSSSWCIRLAF